MTIALVPTGVSGNVHDRRRHARYRSSFPISVSSTNRQITPGMCLEISESGMSALLSDALTVGETVELEPVAGGRVSALIRRQNGKIYPFEFLNLTPVQVQRITMDCDILPLYPCNRLGI